jgi:hypothetical protein
VAFVGKGEAVEFALPEPGQDEVVGGAFYFISVAIPPVVRRLYAAVSGRSAESGGAILSGDIGRSLVVIKANWS